MFALNSALEGAATLDSTTMPRDAAPSEPLTPALLRELWSRTYNHDGKPDWSHIFPYYHPDIVFHDSIQRIEGIDAFKALCKRLTRRCEQINMDIQSVASDGQSVFFQWKMQMKFRRWPSAPIYGCSRLTLDESGRIVEQRDYYDLWGDIFDGIPWFRRGYRWFMHQYFG
jgi:limonene-1,2-epoxide hydrolase